MSKGKRRLRQVAQVNDFAVVRLALVEAISLRTILNNDPELKSLRRRHPPVVGKKVAGS
jgi:hypothetical protein